MIYDYTFIPCGKFAYLNLEIHNSDELCSSQGEWRAEAGLSNKARGLGEATRLNERM